MPAATPFRMTVGIPFASKTESISSCTLSKCPNKARRPRSRLNQAAASALSAQASSSPPGNNANPGIAWACNSAYTTEGSRPSGNFSDPSSENAERMIWQTVLSSNVVVFPVCSDSPHGSGNSYGNRHASISEQPIAGILPPFGGDDTSKHNGICPWPQAESHHSRIREKSYHRYSICGDFRMSAPPFFVDCQSSLN